MDLIVPAVPEGGDAKLLLVCHGRRGDAQWLVILITHIGFVEHLYIVVVVEAVAEQGLGPLEAGTRRVVLRDDRYLDNSGWLVHGEGVAREEKNQKSSKQESKTILCWHYEQFRWW